jgi:hypothetical protein
MSPSGTGENPSPLGEAFKVNDPLALYLSGTYQEARADSSARLSLREARIERYATGDSRHSGNSWFAG